MRLLIPEMIDEIVRRARTARLFDQRDALLSQIEADYVSKLETGGPPIAQLMLDLGALNVTTQPVGGDLPLRRWLLNASLLARLADDIDWFAARAAEVQAQLLPRPGEAGKEATAAIATLKELAAEKPGMQAALTRARTEFKDIAAQLKLLIGYKRLHDGLHDVQLWRLPPIQDTLMLKEPLSQRSVRGIKREVDQLGERVESARRDLDYFPAGSDERGDEAGWVEEFADEHATLAAAIMAADKPAALVSVFRLRSLVKTRMSRLNFQLYFSVRDLRIERLVDHLRTFAAQHLEVDDARAVLLRDAATQLLGLQHEINLLKNEHNQWQDVDDKIWTAEDYLMFLNDGAGELDRFTRLWPDVIARIKRIADAAPGDWYALITLRQQAFADHCPLPARAPIADLAYEEFNGFTFAARKHFFDVDRELIDRCSRLEQVAQPLEDLASKL